MKKEYKILENKKLKILKGEDYNFIFNKQNGFFARWGKQKEDDPDFSPVGPEIADIEISTICSGVGSVCKFCYKANTPTGKNMSLETFKKLFEKLPRAVSQIAFGIGDINANPDLWKIMEYTRENGVIPNITVNGFGITDEIAQKLVNVCGAVAVSCYDKNYTYDTVKKLTDLGMTQINIHQMICEENFEFTKSVIQDRMTDERLKNMNAIVFLSLKKQGRAKKGYTQLSQEKFKELVDLCLDKNIAFGFDSCSAMKLLESVKGNSNYKQFETVSEPCESTLFSSYFSVDGKFFPCSFVEGTDGWEDGIDIINMDKNFLEGLWYNEKTKEFRNKTIECRHNCQSCSVFDI